MEVKRNDITLGDWTKGISADEFAWGSYFYAEWISTWYSTKWFELWYGTTKNKMNSREEGYSVALDATYEWGFMSFTRDWCMESVDFYNGTQNWAVYAYLPRTVDKNGYLNWVIYWDYAIGIRQNWIDVIDYQNAYDTTSQLLTNTDLSDSTWWTIWAWWIITTDWAEHTAGETSTLQSTPSGTYTTDDVMRCAVKVKWWTAWNLTLTLGNGSQEVKYRSDWWFVVSLKCNTTTELVITPSSAFNWTIQEVELYLYDNTAVQDWKATLVWGNDSNKHPALIWEWDLYIWTWARVNIISLQDRWRRSKLLIDQNFEIVALTQQAGNIIVWATDGKNSRQYYWNWVDSVATEVIEWKWLIIQWVTGTETISYVLTTSWLTIGSVEWYEYRLYAVSWYQRNLIASKLYQDRSDLYLDAPHYNLNKKFDFNDVTNSQWMCIFLDSLYIPWCDGGYKYGSDIAWLKSSWSRPIKYDTWSTNLILGQRGHFLGLAHSVDWSNYITEVDNRRYTNNWYLVTDSIYWDRLSTKKSLEKLKIWYKNLPSTIGNIKVYAIVDDTYFWRFRPTVTPTNRPSVWDVYTVANNTTAKVINVDTTNWVITLVTVSDWGSYLALANTTLTKVSWSWDDSITVGYNFDNMCLIKTIESDSQCYGSDFIFGKDFIQSYLPYWYKIQFVIELNSTSSRLSPEVYELSIHSDIDDVVL